MSGDKGITRTKKAHSIFSKKCWLTDDITWNTEAEHQNMLGRLALWTGGLEAAPGVKFEDDPWDKNVGAIITWTYMDWNMCKNVWKWWELYAILWGMHMYMNPPVVFIYEAANSLAMNDSPPKQLSNTADQ